MDIYCHSVLTGIKTFTLCQLLAFKWLHNVSPNSTVSVTWDSNRMYHGLSIVIQCSKTIFFTHMLGVIKRFCENFLCSFEGYPLPSTASQYVYAKYTISQRLNQPLGFEFTALIRNLISYHFRITLQGIFSSHSLFALKRSLSNWDTSRLLQRISKWRTVDEEYGSLVYNYDKNRYSTYAWLYLPIWCGKCKRSTFWKVEKSITKSWRFTKGPKITLNMVYLFFLPVKFSFNLCPSHVRVTFLYSISCK